jgi:glycerophosphoryl diester phosphodiesterase
MIVENESYDKIKEVMLYGVNDTINHVHLRVPLLEEYLDCCKKYNKICVIEFKFLFSKENIYKVIDIIKSYDYLDNCIFISFIYENLEVLRELDNNLKLQYLMSSWDMDKINKCLEKNLDLDILYTEITKERVDFMHSHNLVVNVWTVNDKEKGEYLVDCGVDFITTNILE